MEDIDEDKKKKALLQLWGGDEMISIFEHDGKVTAQDTFDQAVEKEDANFVNAIIDNDIPDALTEKMVQDATNQNDRLARLKDCI